MNVIKSCELDVLTKPVALRKRNILLNTVLLWNNTFSSDSSHGHVSTWGIATLTRTCLAEPDVQRHLADTDRTRTMQKQLDLIDRLVVQQHADVTPVDRPVHRHL